MEGLQTLSTVNVRKKFYQGGKELEVLSGISQTFERGKSYGIVGVSGSGKSTFMHILGGLDAPTSGQVRLFGQPLHSNYIGAKKTAQHLLRNEHLGFVFQFHYLVKELSVIENVMLPGLIGGMSRMDALVRAHDLLDFVGLGDKADGYPVALSGGEQQRVSIIRAMFNKPAFLIADEPTGNLDEGNAELAVKLLLDGCKLWEMGLILCSHDRHVYERMDRVLRMQHGVLSIEK